MNCWFNRRAFSHFSNLLILVNTFEYRFFLFGRTELWLFWFSGQFDCVMSQKPAPAFWLTRCQNKHLLSYHYGSWYALINSLTRLPNKYIWENTFDGHGNAGKQRVGSFAIKTLRNKADKVVRYLHLSRTEAKGKHH